MRRLLSYPSFNAPVSFQLQKLVALIAEKAKPDSIYLLATTWHRSASESIFSTQVSTFERPAEYHILILLPDLGSRQSYEWQEEIERYCSAEMAITAIVLITSTFMEWLIKGHRFSKNVVELAAPIYDAGKCSLPAKENSNTCTETETINLVYKDGLNKANEFFVGAELFTVRKQYSMAAFMLHQAAEQALRTILQTGTGYYCCTHNLDRLIRYASMVLPQLQNIFPRSTEQDKQLFKLLQKAYSDSRYTNDYSINKQQICLLTEKVDGIIKILVQCRFV